MAVNHLLEDLKIHDFGSVPKDALPTKTKSIKVYVKVL